MTTQFVEPVSNSSRAVLLNPSQTPSTLIDLTKMEQQPVTIVPEHTVHTVLPVVPTPPPLPTSSAFVDTSVIVPRPSLPHWPGDMAKWWFQVQIAAIRDASNFFIQESGQQASPCSNLSIFVQPWVNSSNQLQQQLQVQQQRYQQLQTRLKTLMSNMTSNQKVLLNSIQTVLNQILSTVRQSQRQMEAVFDKLTLTQQVLFKGLLQSLAWQVQSQQKQKLQIGQEKIRLHQQLPTTADPVREARDKGVCMDALRVVKEKYILFLQQMDTGNTCIKQNLLSIQLTVNNTDNLATLINSLIQSTESVQRCLSDPAHLQQLQSFREEMNRVLQLCGENVAATATRLTSLEEAHRMIDQVADSVLNILDEETKRSITNICKETALHMNDKFQEQLTQLQQLKQAYDAGVETNIAVLQNRNESLLEQDPNLFSALTDTMQAIMDLVGNSYYTIQAHSQMNKLVKMAEQYCQTLQRLPALLTTDS